MEHADVAPANSIRGRANALLQLLGGAPAAEADKMLRSILTRPDAQQVLELAAREADKAAQPRLVDLLLSADAAWPPKLWVLARAGELARQSGRARLFEARIAELVQAHAPISFRELDYIEMFPNHMRAALREAKYAGAGGTEHVQANLATSHRLFDLLEIEGGVADFLFANSRGKGLDRSGWDRWFKAARIYSHVLHDHDMWRDVFAYIDRNELAAVARELEAAKGAVVMFGHIGYVRPTLGFLRQVAPDCFVFGSGEGRNILNAKANARAALFAALKAVLQKKVVAIAPDGGHGNTDTEISVFGRKVQIGSGAAFLAYEARRPAFWLTLHRNRWQLVPRLVRAPARLDGESYADYRARFASFCEERIVSHLTGRPADLILTRRWQKEVRGFLSRDERVAVDG